MEISKSIVAEKTNSWFNFYRCSAYNRVPVLKLFVWCSAVYFSELIFNILFIEQVFLRCKHYRSFLLSL